VQQACCVVLEIPALSQRNTRKQYREMGEKGEIVVVSPSWVCGTLDWGQLSVYYGYRSRKRWSY